MLQDMLAHVKVSKKKKEVYKCSECSKHFPYPSLLKKHLVTHRQSYHCNTYKRVFKRLDHFSKQQSNCTEIIPSFISSVLHSTTTDFEVLSISSTTHFEALSISKSNSFVEDQVVPEITFEKN